jgi:hypothetical protein
MSESPKLLDYWQPPPGVGDPVACFATTFTFDSEFFETECLARFLGLDSPRGDRGGVDLAYLLQTEEKLAESQVSVIVDRSVRPGKRSLRWDVIPIGVRRGLHHSKVSVLLWHGLARFIVGSANLTPAGYRNQVEAVVAFDAHPGSQVPAPFLLELLAALGQILARASGDPSSPGPVGRAQRILDQSERQIRQFGLPQVSRRGRLLASVTTSLNGSHVLDGIRRVWVGGPPRHATVLSPFWDLSGPSGGAAKALVALLASRGSVSATFLAAIDPLNGSYRVPPSLQDLSSQRLSAEIRAFASPDDRRLHAKVVVLQSDTWIAGILGSSNFTEAGLGLSPHSHLEVNVAVGAPIGSDVARSLRELTLTGDLVPDDATFAAGDDEDERPEDPIPWGFVACLFEPGTPSRLHFQFDARELPAQWHIMLPAGLILLSSEDWTRNGAPVLWTVELESSDAVVWLDVKWREAALEHIATWIVNVTDSSRLPPPSELRDLPVELLIRALASSRPIYLTLADAFKAQLGTTSGYKLVVDPLKKFDDPGSIFHRVRDFSSAMAGLRRRLERPALTYQALEWRLRGPVGPLALAQGISREGANERMPGESAFLLAELVLTLNRIAWTRALEHLDKPAAGRELVDNLVTEIKSLKTPSVPDRGLRRYVRNARESSF